MMTGLGLPPQQMSVCHCHSCSCVLSNVGRETACFSLLLGLAHGRHRPATEKVGVGTDAHHVQLRPESRNALFGELLLQRVERCHIAGLRTPPKNLSCLTSEAGSLSPLSLSLSPWCSCSGITGNLCPPHIIYSNATTHVSWL